MNKKTISLLLALLLVAIPLSGCASGIRAKTFIPAESYTVGAPALTLELPQYFSGTAAGTVYQSNYGTVTEAVLTIAFTEAGTFNVEVTATEAGKTATLNFTLNVEEAPTAGLAAKPFTPKANYETGESALVLELEEYFENTTAETVYTANKGSVDGSVFTFEFTEAGEFEVEIAASEGTDSATLAFTLSVEEVNIYAALAELNKQRALTYAHNIFDRYWLPGNTGSRLTPGGGTPHLWPYTEQLAMYNAVLRLLDPVDDAEDYALVKSYLEKGIGGLRHYRVRTQEGMSTVPFGTLNEDKSSWAIYNSSRSSQQDNAGTSKGGIYFDDNIWVAKELYYAYQLTDEQQYLNECINILNWIIDEGFETGISAQGAFAGRAMNGIYWNWGFKDLHPNVHSDSQNASLNTCSISPTAMMLAKVYNVLTDPEDAALAARYLDVSRKLFNFANNVLKASDKIYQDKVFVFKNAAGDLYLDLVDNQKLGYNTGCMMTAGVELYKIATNPLEQNMFLTLTKETADSSDVYFANRIAKPGYYAYNPHSWFTSFLLMGYIDLYNAGYEDAEEYIGHMSSSLDYAWENNRDSMGLVAPSWILGWDDPSAPGGTGNSESNPRQILLQSANGHCYAMLAWYYAGRAAN